MDFLTILIGIVSLLGLFYFLLRDKRPPNFPPGPIGWPILGNLIEFGEEPHKPAADMANIYGDILGAKFGSYLTIILNNPEDIRTIFNSNDYTRKFGYNEIIGENYGHSNLGVLKSEGEVWQEMRRFSLKTLRDFGFGKKSLNSVMQEEIEELVEKLKVNLGQPIKTEKLFNPSILNVIWRLVAGQRFELGDPRLNELLGLLHEFMLNLVSGLSGMFYVFPFLVTMQKSVPALFPKEAVIFRQKLFAFLRKSIQEHRQTLETGNPRDFIDTYLEEFGNRENSNFKDDNDLNLIVLLMDFFIAGSDTTSSTLVWAFFLMALHPEKQEKMFNEIQSIVGQGVVTLDDRSKCHYTEGVLAEIYRISSLAPLGEPHSPSKDMTYKGYNIPKNTAIYANLHAVHFSQEIWGDPHVFRPERHLIQKNDGSVTFFKHNSLMPFSTGRRVCLGQNLAHDEIFMFLTNLLQNFKITMPEDEPKHSLMGQVTGLVLPEPHNIILLNRY